MKKFYFISFFLFLSRLLFASDSLVYSSELIFDNQNEEQIYLSVLKGNSEMYFDAFYINGNPNVSNLPERKSVFIDAISTIKFSQKRAKYVKNIYKDVHEKYLKKYMEQAYFNDVFSLGVYNCVTACALYAMAFEKLGIPFVIKETPAHVYIVAYPESDQLLIETTDPIGGFNSFSTSYKSQFVNNLNALKLIDSKEMALGINALFDKYYFNESGLGLRELLGLQYYNTGIWLVDQGKYHEGHQALSKAYILYPSEQISQTLFLSMVMLLSNSDYMDDRDIDLFYRLPRYKQLEVTNDEIVEEFGRLTYSLLIENNQRSKYKEVYDELTEQVKDSTLLLDINFLYNYEMGRLEFNRGRYKQALPYAKKAYECNPNNVDSETMLIGAFMNHYGQSSDLDEAYSTLKSYLDEYENLKENNHVISAWMNLNLMIMANSFIEGKSTKAILHKDIFESVLAENGQKAYDENILGRAYSEAAVYYFKKGHYNSAKRYLNEGLKYAPGNRELVTRKHMIDRN